MNIDEINKALNLHVMDQVEQRARAWLTAAKGADWTATFENIGRELLAVKAENERLVDALKYGVGVMMPEIHAQRTSWPGEVDEFEDRAKRALTPNAKLSGVNDE